MVAFFFFFKLSVKTSISRVFLLIMKGIAMLKKKINKIVFLRVKEVKAKVKLLIVRLIVRIVVTVSIEVR